MKICDGFWIFCGKSKYFPQLYFPALDKKYEVSVYGILIKDKFLGVITRNTRYE